MLGGEQDLIIEANVSLGAFFYMFNLLKPGVKNGLLIKQIGSKWMKAIIN